jgi:hypothetical protein
MGRKSKGEEPDNTPMRLTPLAYGEPVEEAPPELEDELYEDAVSDEDTDEGEEGGQGGGEGGGGGVYFEETEHDFDAAELQGMSLPGLRTALKKGLKLVNRLSKQSEHFLRGFLPDPALRARVVEMTISERGHRTLLLDKGEIVQYQHSLGKLDRVRVSPDLDAERAVKFAMAGFIAAGESINPKHVKFGRSPEFEARMKPIWVKEWKRIQRQETDVRIGLYRDNGLRQTVQIQPRKDPVFSKPAAAPRQTDKLRVDIPRASTAKPRDPQF